MGTATSSIPTRLSVRTPYTLTLPQRLTRNRQLSHEPRNPHHTRNHVSRVRLVLAPALLRKGCPWLPCLHAQGRSDPQVRPQHLPPVLPREEHRHWLHQAPIIYFCTFTKGRQVGRGHDGDLTHRTNMKKSSDGVRVGGI